MQLLRSSLDYGRDVTNKVFFFFLFHDTSSVIATISYIVYCKSQKCTP